MNPKIIIVMCIFDRFENLRRWIHAWNMCEQMGAKLFIINNHSIGMDIDFWKNYCNKKGVEYIIRPNYGYETGIIQDVITENLLKEEEWDVFFFITDDTIPISKKFLTEYIEELSKPDIGVVCMEISGIYTPHIRTTGWCITKEVSKNLQFPDIPITNKDQCYQFEHTGGEATLMSQILRMGKRVVQMSTIENSAIWDTHNTNLNRWDEWHKEFPNYN